MRKCNLILILQLVALVSWGQHRIASFSIQFPNEANAIEIPAAINLDSLTQLQANSLMLYETTGNAITIIPFQVSQHKPRSLSWTISPQTGPAKRTYELIKSVPANFDVIEALNKNGAITFRSNNKNLLRYQYGLVYPPTGIDTNYKRSGFIHPVWTPHGQELTKIQPPDHYHHYGIWNPWTHTFFENDTIDFWNIKGRQGTVRSAKLNSVTNGPVYSELEALHEHVVFKKDGTEKIALNELQTIRVYNPGSTTDYYFVDITSKLSCASQSPLLIIAYRYGGLGWRATEYWDRSNSEMLTSEGKTRDNTDGTKAKWIITSGDLPGNDHGGIVILSHPSNYNHPEPLRIWDKNENGGRGDVFVNFAPTKDKDWLLEPGKTYTLKYRLIVFNGKFDAAKAEVAWQYFAKPVEIKR